MQKFILMPNCAVEDNGYYRPIIRVIDVTLNQSHLVESECTFLHYNKARGFAVMRAHRFSVIHNRVNNREFVVIPPAAEIRRRYHV